MALSAQKPGGNSLGFSELFFIGIGLSMDAFAVSLCKGLGMKKANAKAAVIIGLFFGGFQALMPFIGWLLGRQFDRYILSLGHWVSFILLALIGGKMIIEAKKDSSREVTVCFRLDFKELLALAVATSIDALAVGVTFAFLRVNILTAITIIGVTTFLISVGGVYAGSKFGSRFEKKSQIAGGVILILIGIKILFQHLMP